MMSYYYDERGWYTGEQLPGRDTDIEPPMLSETTTIGEMRANFTGRAWLTLPYFEPAPPPPPVPEPQRITRLAFRNRFTQGEKVMLEMAALDDPAAPMAQRQQAATMRSYLADVNAATFIDLDRDDTRAGVQALEAAGLLASGRALEILDAPVQPHEKPAP